MSGTKPWRGERCEVAGEVPAGGAAHGPEVGDEHRFVPDCAVTRLADAGHCEHGQQARVQGAGADNDLVGVADRVEHRGWSSRAAGRLADAPA